MSHIAQVHMPEEKLSRVELAKLNTDKIIKESEKKGYEVARQTTMNVMTELRRIEEKERCLRVKFLDWLSDKLAVWSKSVKTMADNIHSPCAIKLPENKRKKK